jgi:hypothetical protein
MLPEMPTTPAIISERSPGTGIAHGASHSHQQEKSNDALITINPKMGGQA